MNKTITTNLHPCPACGLNAPRAVDADHRLCDGCAADLPATLAHVSDLLRAVSDGLDRHRAAWVATQDALPEPLAQRWAALCAARNAAEGAVIAYTRGRLAAALEEPARRERLAEAYQRLANVQGKIERTRVNVPEMAVLLAKEEAYRQEEARLRREVERLSVARQEVEYALSDRAF